MNLYLIGLSSYLVSKKINLSFEQLRNKYFYTPIITGVQGSNFKKDHCIKIYKGLIFDGNIEYPLILGWDALSLCCSNGKKKCEFFKFHTRYIFMVLSTYLTYNNEGNQIKKKKQNKNKKMH